MKRARGAVAYQSALVSRADRQPTDHPVPPDIRLVIIAQAAKANRHGTVGCLSRRSAKDALSAEPALTFIVARREPARHGQACKLHGASIAARR
jgi:gamma-glutamyl:cysteine ligase YbdK (ATP-grasp superfamily)